MFGGAQSVRRTPVGTPEKLPPNMVKSGVMFGGTYGVVTSPTEIAKCASRSIHLQWPPALLQAMRKILSIFRLEFIEFATPECAIPMNWIGKWILGLAFPLSVVGLLVAWRACHEKGDTRRAHMTNWIAYLIFNFSAPRFVAALQPVGCNVDTGAGSRYLVYTGTVTCGSVVHILLAVAGSLLAFVFGVCPALFFKWRMDNRDLDDDGTKARYSAAATDFTVAEHPTQFQKSDNNCVVQCSEMVCIESKCPTANARLGSCVIPCIRASHLRAMKVSDKRFLATLVRVFDLQWSLAPQKGSGTVYCWAA